MSTYNYGADSGEGHVTSGGSSAPNAPAEPLPAYNPDVLQSSYPNISAPPANNESTGMAYVANNTTAGGPSAPLANPAASPYAPGINNAAPAAGNQPIQYVQPQYVNVNNSVPLTVGGAGAVAGRSSVQQMVMAVQDRNTGQTVYQTVQLVPVQPIQQTVATTVGTVATIPGTTGGGEPGQTGAVVIGQPAVFVGGPSPDDPDTVPNSRYVAVLIIILILEIISNVMEGIQVNVIFTDGGTDYTYGSFYYETDYFEYYGYDDDYWYWDNDEYYSDVCWDYGFNDICTLEDKGTAFFFLLIYGFIPVASAVIGIAMIVCCSKRKCQCCEGCCVCEECCGQCCKPSCARTCTLVSLSLSVLMYFIANMVWLAGNPLLDDPTGFSMCINEDGNGCDASLGVSCVFIIIINIGYALLLTWLCCKPKKHGASC